MAEMGLDRAAEKRRRILDAARLLFVREGLRGTTLEAIARAAGIAKPTLYGYFSDKDAVFTALLDELTDTLTAAFEAGMAGSGTPAQRIGAALAGKYGAIAAVIEASPFAEELYSTHSRVSLRFRALDMQMNETILAVLREAGVREPAIGRRQAEPLARVERTFVEVDCCCGAGTDLPPSPQGWLVPLQQCRSAGRRCQTRHQADDRSLPTTGRPGARPSSATGAANLSGGSSSPFL